MLAGLLCILWRPQYAVVLVLTMFPLEQLLQSYFPFLLYNPKVFNIAVLVVTGMALLSRLSRAEPVAMGYRNIVAITVWLLYGLTWLSVLYTPAFGNAMKSLMEGLPYYFFMLLILPLLIYDTESYRRILFGLMIAGAVICALIYLNPSAAFYGGRLMIEFDPFAAERRGNPLAVADLGGVISLVAILYRSPRAGLMVFALRMVIVLIGLGLAVATGSRGQVLVAVGAALMFFPISRGVANAKQVVVAGAGFLMMVVAIRLVFSTFITFENEERWGVEAMSDGMTERIDMARALLSSWLATPVAWPMGLGVNAYTALDPMNPYVHNLIVEVLCEEGLLGITLLGVAMWFTFDAGRKLLTLKREEPEQRAAVATLAALCVYSFILGLKQGSFIGGPGVFLGWILLTKIHRTEQAILDAETARAEEEELDAEQGAGPLTVAGADTMISADMAPSAGAAHRLESRA